VCVRCAEGYQFARPSSAASARSAAAAGQTMTRFQQTLSRTAPVSSVPLNKYCVVVTDISLFVHNLTYSVLDARNGYIRNVVV